MSEAVNDNHPSSNSIRMSLRNKITLIVVVTNFIIAGVLLLMTDRNIMAITDTEYETRANDIAATVAATIDSKDAESIVNKTLDVLNQSESVVFSDEWGSDAFNAYMKPFSFLSETKEFKSIHSFLQKIQSVNDVECIYLVAVVPEKKAWVYVVDAAFEDACPPGVLDPIYDVNKAILTNPEVGFPAYRTDTEEYGWLMTAGAPIYNSNHKVVGYAMVDVSMNEIMAMRTSIRYTIIGTIVILAIILTILSAYVINRMITEPIGKLEKATKDYAKEEAEETHIFENLNIHTGDEIESLANAMQMMENSLNTEISNLVKVSKELYTTQQLAVRDGLTGIRNKLGYNREAERLEEEIGRGDARFGIAMIDLNYLKRINDEYGHDKGDEALISISNLICNTFVHSPVFRIGGDEFVAVLQNNDYDKREELIKIFEEEIDHRSKDESLEPWQRTSASVGMAVYDPAVDHNVEDVFRRADQAMYKRKLEMKAVRDDI